jgi:hypothetical protein
VATAGEHLAPRTCPWVAEPGALPQKGPREYLRYEYCVVSIAFDILTALAEYPDGEAPIASVKDRLVEVTLSPARLGSVVQKQPSDLLHRYQPRGPDTLQNLFSSGLVERPRPGVWKLTTKGRTFLSGLRSGAPGAP